MLKVVKYRQDAELLPGYPATQTYVANRMDFGYELLPEPLDHDALIVSEGYLKQHFELVCAFPERCDLPPEFDITAPGGHRPRSN